MPVDDTGEDKGGSPSPNKIKAHRYARQGGGERDGREARREGWREERKGGKGGERGGGKEGRSRACLYLFCCFKGKERDDHMSLLPTPRFSPLPLSPPLLSSPHLT
eukprot:205774-Rhodomonas_salina.3